MAGKQGERVERLEAEVQRLTEENQNIMLAIIQLQQSFQLCAKAINEVNDAKPGRADLERVVATVNQLIGNIGVLRSSILGHTDRAIMVIPRDRIRHDG